MRKIIAGMFITLDGVVEAPERWNPPYYDDELNQDVMPLLAGAGPHLLGPSPGRHRFCARTRSPDQSR